MMIHVLDALSRLQKSKCQASFLSPKPTLIAYLHQRYVECVRSLQGPPEEPARSRIRHSSTRFLEHYIASITCTHATTIWFSHAVTFHRMSWVHSTTTEPCIRSRESLLIPALYQTGHYASSYPFACRGHHRWGSKAQLLHRCDMIDASQLRCIKSHSKCLSKYFLRYHLQFSVFPFVSSRSHVLLPMLPAVQHLPQFLPLPYALFSTLLMKCFVNYLSGFLSSWHIIWSANVLLIYDVRALKGIQKFGPPSDSVSYCWECLPPLFSYRRELWALDLSTNFRRIGRKLSGVQGGRTPPTPPEGRDGKFLIVKPD